MTPPTDRTPPRRFPIRFGRLYEVLSRTLGLAPAQAYIDVGETVEVRMGWAFSARFARSDVLSATRYLDQPLSRGVHGWAGRWLVNGAGDRIAHIELRPGCEARVIGVPTRLATLLISVDDPDALASLLAR